MFHACALYQQANSWNDNDGEGEAGMPDVTLEQAAIALGVSVDTVRRRIRLGQLSAHRDAGGRSRVAVPEVPSFALDVERIRQQDQEQLVTLRSENVHLSDLVDELRRQQGQIEAYNAVLREQLGAANESQQELRRLLANAQEQVNRLLTAVSGSSTGS
jgi:excisionase family DNA binding protein